MKNYTLLSRRCRTVAMLLGRACSQPHSGVNIVVYEYTDGTHRTVKQLLP